MFSEWILPAHVSESSINWVDCSCPSYFLQSRSMWVPRQWSTGDWCYLPVTSSRPLWLRLTQCSHLWVGMISVVAQTVKSLPEMQETMVWSLNQEDHLKKEMAIHSSILTWAIPWTEETGGLYSPWGHKESDTTEWLMLTPSRKETVRTNKATYVSY